MLGKGEILIKSFLKYQKSIDDFKNKDIHGYPRIMEDKNEWAREFDRKNKECLEIVKKMPESLQEEIIKYGIAAGTMFISQAVIFWLTTGDAKTQLIRGKLWDMFK